MAEVVGGGGKHSRHGLKEADVLSDLLYRARALFRRNRLEDELDHELQLHLEKLTEKHIHAGMAPASARARSWS